MFNLFKTKTTSSPKQPVQSNFIQLTVRPGVEPQERESRYGDPINAILKENKVGEVTGGGTMLDKPDANGKQGFEFSDIEIEMSSHDKHGLEVLLEALKKSNFPEDTEIMLWDSNDLKFGNISAFGSYLEKN